MKSRNSIFVLLLTLFFTVGLFAQDKEEKKPEYGWKKEAIAIANFTQNNFSDNWGQGGEDSWSWQTDLNAKFIYDQEKYNWGTTAKLSYGQTKVGDADSRKAADEIKLESVYKYKMGLYVNPYFAVTGLTQFTDGYTYTDTSKAVISSFMDPGYFTQSIGVGLNVNKNIKTRFGAALKETVTDKFAETFADGETFRTEFGAESVTDIEWMIIKNIKYVSKLELFSNFKGLDAVDVNWDNMFTSKINDLITVSFNYRILYDKDVSVKRQTKQTLSVGLSYTLF